MPLYPLTREHRQANRLVFLFLSKAIAHSADLGSPFRRLIASDNQIQQFYIVTAELAHCDNKESTDSHNRSRQDRARRACVRAARVSSARRCLAVNIRPVRSPFATSAGYG